MSDFRSFARLLPVVALLALTAPAVSAQGLADGVSGLADGVSGLADGVLAPGLADGASGQGASGPPAWAYSLAHDLMSPFCPGRTLAACPSPQADQLRQWILFQAAAGQTSEELEATLYERFGDVLLSAPKAEGGWGISAYAVPIGGFLLGGPLVAFAIFRLARGRDGAPAASSAISPEGTGTSPSPASSATRTAPVPDAELERLVREEFAGS